MILPDPRTMEPMPRVQCEGKDIGVYGDFRCIVMIPTTKWSRLCYFHERRTAR